MWDRTIARHCVVVAFPGGFSDAVHCDACKPPSGRLAYNKELHSLDFIT
jgi:hypothetical protein